MKRKKLIKQLSNKKNLSSEDILMLYDSLGSSERTCVRQEFEDDLEDEMRERIEETYDYDDIVVSDLSWNVAERLYEELHEEYGTAETEVANLYDQVKLDILKKAFDIYNIEQLEEILNITQAEAM